MVEIESLSRVGFGCYRTIASNQLHEASLLYAIERGCNFIDTASNYMGGESERLIGDLTSKVSTNSLFIMTKAGYASNEDAKKIGSSKLIKVNENHYHSMHPDFLQLKLSLSLSRLKRNWLDAFLLHNPEYLQKAMSEANFRKTILTAAEFLEDRVKKGLIRYWGVSSNTINLDEGVILKKLMNEVSPKNGSNCRFIQFPFNLAEQGSFKRSKEFITTSKANGFYLVSNRPLNANSGSQPIRLSLVTHKDGLDDEIKLHLANVYGILKTRLKDRHFSNDLYEYEPIDLLQKNWRKFSHPDIVENLFNYHLNPFFEKLFNGKKDKTLKDNINFLKEKLKVKALENSANRTKVFLMTNKLYNKKDTIDQHKEKLIRHYLDKGIDSILIGMRRKEYVDNFTSFFRGN